jgi:ribosomal protein S18 acetylase RimI-like enzyme
MVSAQLLPRAYGKHSVLYVDELDTAVNYRRNGVATALMSEIKNLADETDSYELWLGTEKTNTGAQKLYEKLAPDEVEEFVGYTWNLDD